MNKKKYVERFNMIIRCTSISFIFLLVIVFLSLLISLISIGINVGNLYHLLLTIENLLSDLILYSKVIVLLNMLISLVLLLYEVFIRLKYDSLINLVLSVIRTYSIRKFMRRDRFSDGSSSLATKIYRRIVAKMVIGVTNNEVYVFVKSPNNAQSQKILKDVLIELKEEVSNLFPDYTFSDIDRDKRYYSLLGSKKEIW